MKMNVRIKTGRVSTLKFLEEFLFVPAVDDVIANVIRLGQREHVIAVAVALLGPDQVDGPTVAHGQEERAEGAAVGGAVVQPEEVGARERLASNEHVAEHRERILAAIDREIARLQAAQ